MIVTETTTQPVSYPGSPRVPDASDYHKERRRYLARVRRNPGLRQHYLRKLAGYLILRAAWSFGFFPVVLAFWVPFVMAEFNPVVMVQSLLPHLEAFVLSNPEVQARTLSTLEDNLRNVSKGFNVVFCCGLAEETLNCGIGRSGSGLTSVTFD